MSAPYEVWVFDGRVPERLGSVPPGDKAAARSLWRNSHHAVITQGGVVLEPKLGCALKQQTALRVAVLSAWLAAGNAPPEPLPVPGTKVPSSKPARGGRPKPAPAEEDEDELEEDERADDDCDGDDPDDPPEVDLEAALAEDEASAPLLTPAPQESRAKRAPEASQPSTPEASPTLSPKALAKLRAFDAAPPASPRADLDVSPGAREDGSAGTPSPEYSTDASPGPRGDASPTATVPRRLRQVLVQPTTTCPVCGEPSHRYRPELPELLRDLCRRDRTRARAWMFDGKERTPEQARARLIAVAAGELTSHQLTTPAGLVSARAEQAPEDVVATLREAAPAPTPKRPPGRPRIDRTKPPAATPRKPAKSKAWVKLRHDLDQLIAVAGRLGGVEGLRALEVARRSDPITTVAAMSARELAQRGLKHLVGGAPRSTAARCW
nr:hypothetical protein [Deltaproteobacteria bacterium]